MSNVLKSSRPIIAITMGDPRGIGPEVIVKALAKIRRPSMGTPLVLGDAHLLSQIGQTLGLRLKVREVGEDFQEAPPGVLPVLSLSHFSLKTLSAAPPEETSRASFAYVEKAGEMALAGKVQAIVTAPVSKEAIYTAGIPFHGHTEYLAAISRAREFVMMLAGKCLKVALVTTHLPLRKVAQRLRPEKIQSVIEITAQGLQEWFLIKNPRIGVAAFNPHAGEGGLFGKEEITIRQAVRQTFEKGLAVAGPFPADTLFYRARKGEFDAVVCMYHDQGLIPLKLLHFDSAVNITLGLPFIRTSVDHGVAYDIAGRGLASSRSMEEAIRLAAKMARKKEIHKNNFLKLKSKNIN